MKRQKLLRVTDGSTSDVNKYLNTGWYVKDFKPLVVSIGGSLGGSYGTYCYVLMETEENNEQSI